MTAPAGRPAEAALPAHASGADVLRHALAEGLAGLRADRAAALGGDPEAVHRMRVALRRMRAALRAFRPLLRAAPTDAGSAPAPIGPAPALPPPPGSSVPALPAADELQAQDARLRALGRQLGPARDWDVFLDETLAEAADVVIPGLIAALRAAGLPRRRAAYAALHQALADPSVLAALEAELMGWAGTLDRGACPAMEQPVSALAPDLLRRLARHVRRRARGLAHASPEALHALRKSIKRLRYATEMLGSFAAPHAGRAAIDASKTLQDLLGRVNDAATTPSLAAELLAPGLPAPVFPQAKRPGGVHPAARDPRVLAEAIASLAAWAGARGDRARRRVPKAMEALKRAPLVRDQ